MINNFTIVELTNKADSVLDENGGMLRTGCRSGAGWVRDIRREMRPRECGFNL